MEILLSGSNNRSDFSAKISQFGTKDVKPDPRPSRSGNPIFQQTFKVFFLTAQDFPANLTSVEALPSG